jgi:C-terminal processing protease CtpA/Prc
MKSGTVFMVIAAALVCLACLHTQDSRAQQQKMDSFAAERLQQMLREAHDEVKKNYYDPTFHGMDWDAKYRESTERMKQANSLGHGLTVVAGMLDQLNDSHTFFQPPRRAVRWESGFVMKAVGDKAFITQVRPQTDAESKVHPGDEVIAFNKFMVSREILWKLNYVFNVLSPRDEAGLAVKDSAGRQREVSVKVSSHQLKKVVDLTKGDDFWQLVRDDENSGHALRQRYYEMGDVMIWKMPEFNLKDSEIDHMFGIAKKHKALVLDLRENPGGAEVTLDRMIGNVFEGEVKIADRKGRKELKPLVAKGRGKDAFGGKIMVLIDSNSGSAAELFARVMQLEQRGVVVGDRSSGSVMEAKRFSESQGMDTKIFYGFSITEADLIMKDGKTLEHAGVTPDEVVLPSSTDIAEGRDPALTRAAALAGLVLEPGQAGKMFPYEWLPL